MARRSLVPSDCFGCGSLTKPVLPVDDHITGLAWRLSTFCDCLACALLGGCFNILSFWSRANPSRLSSATRELRSARASSLMTSRVPGCASPNISVRTASVRRVSAKPCFFGLPVALTATTSPRTSIAGDSATAALSVSHRRVPRSLTKRPSGCGICPPPTHNREPYDTLLYCLTSCPYRFVCGTDAACSSNTIRDSIICPVCGAYAPRVGNCFGSRPWRSVSPPRSEEPN